MGNVSNICYNSSNSCIKDLSCSVKLESSIPLNKIEQIESDNKIVINLNDNEKNEIKENELIENFIKSITSYIKRFIFKKILKYTKCSNIIKKQENSNLNNINNNINLDKQNEKKEEKDINNNLNNINNLNCPEENKINIEQPPLIIQNTLNSNHNITENSGTIVSVDDTKTSKLSSKREVKNVNLEKIKIGVTPIPEEEITPGGYDINNAPGEILENFDFSGESEQVKQTEKNLGEFIVEQKELYQYMLQYSEKFEKYTIKYPSGEIYSGYFSPNWIKEIYGVQIFSNGSKYVGFYKNGTFDGRGRLILSKGDYYEGDFKNSKANGFGKYVDVKGEIYVGNWINDLQEGQGELILNDESRYFGQFKFGMKNGKGKITWKDTSFYDGEFLDNMFDGFGLYMMRNKRNYRGQWKKGLMNGIGIFSWPDGKNYKGYYLNDKRHGYGIYKGKNNIRYEGRFKNGKQYGIGRIVNENGEVQLGIYQKGKRLKCLNDKDFGEEIEKINKEIENINKFIEANNFFKETLIILNDIQKQNSEINLDTPFEEITPE